MSSSLRPVSRRQRFTRRHLAAALLAAFGSVSCSDSDDPVAPPTLTTVNVALTSPTAPAGITLSASAAGLDQNGQTIALGPVTWSTANSAVAIVSSTGAVTAVAVGSTQIIATAGGRSGQATLTVTPAPPLLSTVNVTLPLASLTFGQTTTATAAGVDQYGAAIATGAVTWSSATPAVATVSTTGVVTGLSTGTAQIIATGAGGIAGQRLVTVTAPPAIVISEVESNGGTPGDWVELFNPTSAAVDISGWAFRDSDTTRTFRIAAGTTIAAGGYYILEEAAFGFGLGAPDDARLSNAFGAPVDTYMWTTHATTTYARCPNASSAFTTSTLSTKGAANNCTPVGSTVEAWPGGDDVVTVDGLNVFQTNLSGLTYEGAAAGRPNILWAVRNGPGTLYRLIFNGTIWTPDPANGWSAGKPLRYTNGTGNPDSEGVTFAAGGSAAGIYVATERNNDASTISRSSILRFDPASSDSALRATNDWNITADLPVVGANLGIETVSWLPDSMLVAKGFFDEAKGRAYAPADYPDHGTGLFFAGVEGNGNLYVYALNHVTNGFTRVATIATGFPGVMGLEYDRESGYLWATCDDTCGNKFNILEISSTAGPTLGRFGITRRFDKPASLPNVNNEGFAFTTNAECVAGRKPVFWADDSETGGHAIRRGSIACGVIPPALRAVWAR